MKKKLFSVVFFSVFGIMPAQSWQWARHFGSTSDDACSEICSDPAGNIYLTGQFFSPYSIFGTDTITTIGLQDAFIVKMTNTGDVIWVKQAGGYDPNAGYNAGMTIAYESLTNSIIVAGSEEGSNQTVGSCGTGAGFINIYLAKLDLNGNCTWAISQVASNGFVTALITIDNVGSIYMLGFNTAMASFNNGTNIKSGCYLAKFNSSNGKCVWAKNISPSYSTCTLLGIIYYQGNLFLGGCSQSDTLNIDTSVVHCHNHATFISKFDTTGNVQWVKTMGGSKLYGGGELGMDTIGNIYVTGYFKDTAYFGSTLLVNGTYKDWYIAKYNNSGNFIWVRQVHADSVIRDAAISTDAHGNSYATGTLTGSATFGTINVNTASSGNNMFVTRYDSSGNCLGVKLVPMSGSNYPGGVLGSGNACYVAGFFSSTATFDGNGITSYGGSDCFVAQLSSITGIAPSGINVKNNQLLIYANPNKGICNVTIPNDFLNDKNLTLSIYDSSGKLIQQLPVTVTQGTIVINLQEEAAGMYNITLSDNIEMYTGKIVLK